jgi:hypothetical protein
MFSDRLCVSSAIRNADSSKDFNAQNLYQSFGTKFSIIRGGLSSKAVSILSSIHELQSEIAGGINRKLSDQLDSDSIYQRLRRERLAKIGETGSDTHSEVLAISAKMEQRQEKIKSTIIEDYSGQLDRLQKEAASFKVERFGFFIDVAGGLSLEFVNRTFNQSRLYNAGAWLTFGANYANGLSLMGIARFLQNPKKVFADDFGVVKIEDVSTFDAGGRLVYGQPSSRFSISSEAIYRSVLTKNTIAPSWRWVLNAI